MKIKRPMLIAALLCIVCVIAVFYCQIAIFAAIFFVAIAIALNFFKFKNAKFTVILFMSVVIIISLSFSLLKIKKAETISEKRVSESFVITSSPYFNGSNFSADAVCLSDNTLKKGDKIRLYYKGGDLKVGDTCFAKIELSSTADSDYKSSFYSEGIYLSGYIKEFKKVSNDSSFLCFLPRLRKSINEVMNKASISYEAKSVTKAITVGDKNEFTTSFENDVKAAGVSHVFVVSGMHLVILMGSFLKLVTRVMYNKYYYALLSFSGVIIISLICGFTMSIMRAAVMYLLMTIAPLLGRDNDPLNCLGATVCFLTIASPYTIFSVAFQLSAAATFGILFLTDFINEKLCEIFNIKNIFLLKLVEMMSVTISATVMTAPVAIYHFELLSTVALITNLLITHAITYALLLSAIGIVVGLIFTPSFLSSAILYAGGVLSEYSITIIKYFASLPMSSLNLPRVSAIVFVLLIVLLVLYKNIDKKQRYILSRRVKQI